jgi:hypothetical protein
MGFQPSEQRRVILEMPGDDVQDFALVLHLAGNAHQPRLQQLTPLALRQTGPNDDVGVPSLVFQGHENHTLAGTGMLSADDQTGGTDLGAMRQSKYLGCGQQF